MSMKRSSGSSRSTSGADGAKVDRDHLLEYLKKVAVTGATFTPVDIALVLGAGEPLVAKTLLGLAVEGCLEKVEAGRYKTSPFLGELTDGDFQKMFTRASRTDTVRLRDVSEIARLKQNNDTMRARLLSAIAERDHYLAALRKHGIDAGPVPPPKALAPIEEAPAADNVADASAEG